MDLSALIAVVAGIVGLLAGGFVWRPLGRSEGRREAETSRDLSEHQQAQKGRQAASNERARTNGFDPQHLKDAWGDRTDRWLVR